MPLNLKRIAQLENEFLRAAKLQLFFQKQNSQNFVE